MLHYRYLDRECQGQIQQNVTKGHTFPEKAVQFLSNGLFRWNRIISDIKRRGSCQCRKSYLRCAPKEAWSRHRLYVETLRRRGEPVRIWYSDRCGLVWLLAQMDAVTQTPPVAQSTIEFCANVRNPCKASRLGRMMHCAFYIGMVQYIS